MKNSTMTMEEQLLAVPVLMLTFTAHGLAVLASIAQWGAFLALLGLLWLNTAILIDMTRAG